jgi:hypothetical protein
MQVYKALFKVINKNKIQLLIYVVVFLTLSIALTSTGAGQIAGFSETKFKIAVFNEDAGSAVSDGLVDYLGGKAIIVGVEDDEQKLQDALFFRDVEMILRIPKGFSNGLMESEIINPVTYNLEDFKGSYYIAGNDFMETTDLCASKLLMMKPGDKTVYFLSHYWIPESKLKDSPDDVDYEQWKRDGYLTIVEGNSVDSSVVANWQYELFKEYDLKPFKSGYDNRFAKDYIRRFEETFGEDIAINVPQDAKCLNNPMRRLEADLRDKLVNYNNRHGDFWCFRNTGIRVDGTSERIQPCKLKTTHRIDGTAAAIDAYAVFEWYQSEFLTEIGA